jgi:16S rRNA C967 or C1407 C5-methylase (RsmB/RsmF family)
MEIKPTYVTFEQSKWLKKKGFDEECTRFYVKSNSKLFGIDEHNRYYPIVNKPKELWIVGNTVTLNAKNVLLAPEQWQVVEWVFQKYNIWVSVQPNEPFTDDDWCMKIFKNNKLAISLEGYDSPQEAYSAAFDYILTNNLMF